MAVTVCGNEREEQGRQSFLKGDARQDAITPGREGGDTARDGSAASGPGPARPEREREGPPGPVRVTKRELSCSDQRQKKLVETGDASVSGRDDQYVEHHHRAGPGHEH